MRSANTETVSTLRAARLRRFASCQLSDLRNLICNQEMSILGLLMEEDGSCEVRTRAMRCVTMVVQSDGSALCTVKICSFLKSLATI